MAKIESRQLLAASLLDRLLDDEPENTHEAPTSRHQLLRDMKSSVRRDLENLLNTRPLCAKWPAELRELEKSSVNYGVPDFSGLAMSSGFSREQLCQNIESVIRAFEPRFKTVKVVPLENVESIDRTLRFRIDALLWADPAPEPVVFDSSMQAATGNFEVKGAST
jgi:type VI secretion system protein ImpF